MELALVICLLFKSKLDKEEESLMMPDILSTNHGLEVELDNEIIF